ncbi:hypothetical protein [Acinetobacter sp. ANC 3781]|uniref:hypothetical protein n=1 Tax=Acinetobacter sp. ANC 3781 TaxID=2529835 RepID=UPI0013F17A2C|nr:hypothetical protein [Acinetobacter sp. ANC 3781]
MQKAAGTSATGGLPGVWGFYICMNTQVKVPNTIVFVHLHVLLSISIMIFYSQVCC